MQQCCKNSLKKFWLNQKSIYLYASPGNNPDENLKTITHAPRLQTLATSTLRRKAATRAA